VNGLSQEAEDKIKKFMTSPGFFPDLAEFLQKITPCPTQIFTEMN